MLPILQVLGAFFGFVMLYLTHLYYKKNSYNKFGTFMWVIIWCGFIFLAVFPSVTYGIMQSLKIERTVDFFVIGGFFVFSIIIFRTYILTKKLEVKVEKIVSSIAKDERKNL